MNAITSGLRNWQTTLIGVVLAILLVIQSNDLSNWQEWIVPALIAGLGVLSRDANKTSESSGIKMLLCLLALTPLLLTSCGMEINGSGYLTYVDPNSGAKAGLTYDEDGVAIVGKFPILDDDGNVIGYGRIETPKIDLLGNEDLPEVTSAK